MNNSRQQHYSKYHQQTDSNFRRYSHSPQFRNNFNPQNTSSPVSSRRNNYFNNSDNQNRTTNSPNFRHHRRYRPFNQFNNYENRDADISLYYNAEITKDPWLDLENKVKYREVVIDDKEPLDETSSSDKSDVSSTKSDDEL